MKLPGELARRVDRLSRAAHAFHRFAHHPLCGRYAGELVRLGRRSRICRGCTLAAAGAPAGLALGLAFPAGGAVALGLSLAALGAAQLGRPTKWASRFAPAAGLAAALAAGLVRGGAGGVALAGAAAASGLAFWLLYRRRGPDRTPCESCPEYRVVEICSGFQPLLRREKAFQRLASRWLAAARPSWRPGSP